MDNTLNQKPNFTRHRTIDGAPVVADSVVYSDFAIREAVNCLGFETIEGYVRISGGVVPTVELENLAVMRYTDEAGVQVEELASVDTSATLSDGDLFEMSVNEGRVFLRLNAVTGSPTKVEIFVAGGKRFSDATQR
jgi:hypothetical protein